MSEKTGEALQVTRKKQMKTKLERKMWSNVVPLQRMWKCKYIETSAKQGTNINELFEELLKMETKKMTMTRKMTISTNKQRRQNRRRRMQNRRRRMQNWRR